VLRHRAQGFLDGVVRADGHRLALGHFPGPRRSRVPTFGDAPYDDVAIAHHSLEPVVLAADGQGADVEVTHLASGVDERVVLANAFDLIGHDLSCCGHVISSSCSSWCSFLHTRRLTGETTSTPRRSAPTPPYW